MTHLMLLTKSLRADQIRHISGLLEASFESLDVETKLAVSPANRWVQVTLSGKDETVATSYLREKFGFCPVSLENVERFATLKGYIESGKGSEELQVDVGVFRPETVFTTVSLCYLQAKLVDGRKLALKRIVELFGFFYGVPLTLKIVRVDRVQKKIEAELAPEQHARLTAWQESLLERLILLGSPLQMVKKALRHTGLSRDIISVESLGVFEHVLTCKLGTDAAGVIPLIGRRLRPARFFVFSPRKIREILGSQTSVQ